MRSEQRRRWPTVLLAGLTLACGTAAAHSDRFLLAGVEWQHEHLRVEQGQCFAQRITLLTQRAWEYQGVSVISSQPIPGLQVVPETPDATTAVTKGERRSFRVTGCPATEAFYEIAVRVATGGAHGHHAGRAFYFTINEQRAPQGQYRIKAIAGRRARVARE